MSPEEKLNKIREVLKAVRAAADTNAANYQLENDQFRLMRAQMHEARLEVVEAISKIINEHG